MASEFTAASKGFLELTFLVVTGMAVITDLIILIKLH